MYILASKRNGTPYIGVTSDLAGRVRDHKEDLREGFTEQYGVHRLVYFEEHPDVRDAIVREKQLKKWRRAWKLRLIEKQNPDWKDLYEQLVF
ncbi:MAG: GIY-YIG nuclease family protein [Rhodothermales bacterium]